MVENEAGKGAIDWEKLKAIVAIRTVELSNPLVEKHLAANRSIMIDKTDRLFRGTNYVPHRDDMGWYIRQGKRGTLKTYLSKCKITYINGDPTLFQFRLSP